MNYFAKIGSKYTSINARYECTDIKDVVDKQHHQNVHQKADLLAFLKQNEMLFDVSLGVYPHSKVQCMCISSLCPTSTCPHSIMNWTISLTHCSIQRERASPSFVIPKIGGNVCWIGDMHQLNAVIGHMQFPLSIITDIIFKHIGHKFSLNLTSVCNATL
jgi:hypothetical protein